MSSHNVDEMYVKVGVDTSEYDKKVEELTQSNEKLAEGLEDTEKQFEKTSKSSRENSKDIKNVTGEYQKLATGLGNVLSSLARFGAAAIAGTGIAAYTDKVAKMNLAIADSAKLRNEDYQTMIKWKYASSELRANPEAFQREMLKVKDGINALNETGEAGMLQYFTEFGIEILDDELKARKIEDLLLDLSFAIDNKENKERVHLLGREYGLEEITNAFLLNSHKEVLEARARQEKRFVFSDEDLENLSEFNKNMTELKNRFNALGDSLVSNLLPNLIKTQNGILEFIDDSKEKGASGMADDLERNIEYFFSNKDPEAKELLYKHGEENFDRWIKEQGYGFFKGNPNNLSKDELEKISLVGTLSDKYGRENVENLIRANTTYNERNLSNKVSGLSLEKTREVIEGNADQFREWDAIKDSLKNNPKLLEMEEGWKRKFNESPLLKGLLGQGGEVLGKDVQLELKSGNELSKVGNDWLKKISESPSLKSLDSVLRKVLSEADTNTYIEGVGHLMPGGVISGGREDRKKAAMQYFMRMGWTKEQAAGIVANLDRESGLDPRAANHNEMVKGQRFSSYGIAQWNRERLDLFKRKFGKHVKDASFEEQLAFVQYELENTHKKAGDALRRTTNTDDATRVVTEDYEVPANQPVEVPTRQKIARDLVGVDFNAWSNSLRIPNSRNTPAQAVASNSNIEVSIGDVMVQTTAETLSGVGQDMSEAIKARMTLGQLTTGAV